MYGGVCMVVRWCMYDGVCVVVYAWWCMRGGAVVYVVVRGVLIQRHH